jgi:hypothetical protein
LLFLIAAETVTTSTADRKTACGASCANELVGRAADAAVSISPAVTSLKSRFVTRPCDPMALPRWSLQ